MNEKMDMRISGSSTMPGGEYDRVSISGSGTVQGDLRCQSLSCSGSARVQGDVDCAGEVRSSGSSKVTGSITCESLSCSGAVKCEGSILSRGRIHSSGAMKVSGSLEGGEVDVSGGLEAADIRCQELRCSGAMNVSGGVEAEAVRISGMAGIPGLLNAETVEIAANRGIRIGSIGGGSIRIYRPSRSPCWACSAAAAPASRQAISRAMTWTWNTPRPTWSGDAGSASARAAPSGGWSTARVWTPCPAP